VATREWRRSTAGDGAPGSGGRWKDSRGRESAGSDLGLARHRRSRGWLEPTGHRFGFETLSGWAIDLEGPLAAVKCQRTCGPAASKDAEAQQQVAGACSGPVLSAC
jgi:hypothetical protein